ncbi:NUDIX hydrolase [Dictyobacter formicarum]|uniref:Nudix hydrolase domain-containing protein n=1 Tax=Dictyobacter formicarum TaxID=2778368 RepID=A0ABQ3VSI7_9CHLR|nr:NUDIX hydrolase [Dictyobacter formicarum]GHO89252.1 hypothetical protein KSZ_72580 [Dictyobacter formicarum]
MTQNIRPRAAAVVLRNNNSEILLVLHHWRDGSESWILPGGGLNPGERAEEAALRELFEETGLRGRNPRFLFESAYDKGISSTFLVEVDHNAQAILGYDPEDEGQEHIMLQGLAWFPIADVAELPEVQRTLECLCISP